MKTLKNTVCAAVVGGVLAGWSVASFAAQADANANAASAQEQGQQVLTGKLEVKERMVGSGIKAITFKADNGTTYHIDAEANGERLRAYDGQQVQLIGSARNKGSEQWFDISSVQAAPAGSSGAPASRSY
jgi:hypothetical protein